MTQHMCTGVPRVLRLPALPGSVGLAGKGGQVHYFDKPYKFWELPGDKQPDE
jgi:hypothetical protein